MTMLRAELTPLFQQRRLDNGPFSKARYKVTSKPVLSSLDQILRIKQAKNSHPDVPNHKLADIAGVVIGNEHAIDGQDVVQLKSNRVHLALKKAESLIANVAAGRFPDFSQPTRPKRARSKINWEKF